MKLFMQAWKWAGISCRQAVHSLVLSVHGSRSCSSDVLLIPSTQACVRYSHFYIHCALETLTCLPPVFCSFCRLCWCSVITLRTIVIFISCHCSLLILCVHVEVWCISVL
jgi:hypothetical protein